MAISRSLVVLHFLVGWSSADEQIQTQSMVRTFKVHMQVGPDGEVKEQSMTRKSAALNEGIQKLNQEEPLTTVQNFDLDQDTPQTCPPNQSALSAGCGKKVGDALVRNTQPLEDAQGGGYVCSLRDGSDSKLKIGMVCTSEFETEVVPNETSDWGAAQCPSGTTIVGGGCNATDLQVSYPDKEFNGWTCGGKGTNKILWAVCATIPDYYETKTVANESERNTAEVFCTDGFYLLGGGCEARSDPFISGYSMPVTPPVDGGPGGGWSCGGFGSNKKAWAICGRMNACMSGWKLGDGFCYKFTLFKKHEEPNQAWDHESAESLCEGMIAPLRTVRLAEIYSEAANTAVAELVGKYTEVHIGLKYSENVGLVWEGGDSAQYQATWHEKPAAPGDCARISGSAAHWNPSGWDNWPCAKPLRDGYVCSYKL